MKEQIKLALDLAKSGFYEDARHVLNQIDHPDVSEWLQMVGEMEHEAEVATKSKKRKSKSLPRHPWDVLGDFPGSGIGKDRTVAFVGLSIMLPVWILYFATWGMFWMVLVKPYALILHWRQLQRPDLMRVYAVVYGVIVLLMLAFLGTLFNYRLFINIIPPGSIGILMLLLIADLFFLILFPFIIVRHQQRVWERLTGEQSLRTYYGGLLLIVFLVAGGLLSLLFWPVLRTIGN